MLIKQQKSNGFSLIELLVVISIIAVLSALLMANFMGARERARDAQKIDGLNSLKTALRMYYNDNQSYPTDKNIILGTGFTAYIANVGDTSFEYSQPNGSDGFILIIGLEAGAGNDDMDSQIKCGIPSPEDKVFAVCAN
jgi:prepilin-type N-terminal cleavage/methylation domain-containing protein